MDSAMREIIQAEGPQGEAGPIDDGSQEKAIEKLERAGFEICHMSNWGFVIMEKKTGPVGGQSHCMIQVDDDGIIDNQYDVDTFLSN